MLVNLRYMALLVGFIHRVPSKIINLWNLETFILRSNHWERFHLPETIWKMKRLRHVDAGDKSTVDLDNDVGKDSSKLTNVESFSSVTIVNGESGEELLRRLSSVRKLRCRYPSPCWDGVGQKFELLPKLDEYLTVLESLHIASRGIRYPCELNFPVTLKKLTLWAFALPWSEISKIAKLPCLEVLKLSMGAFSGSRWDAENEEFPNLKFLKLHMLDVADWIASVDTFPCLEQLIVIKCDNLVEIPVCFGEVSTLKAIEIYNVLESLNIVSDRVRYTCVFSLPATLKKLTLSGFNLPWIEFSKIAQLPCLEVLKLMSNAFVGSRWDVENEEFPDLKFLELNELDIASWISSAKTFPSLAQLIVTKCHNLVEVPACFAEIPTLKAVKVNLCNKGAEESAIQIQSNWTWETRHGSFAIVEKIHSKVYKNMLNSISWEAKHKL